jgi:hypothetical protein
MIYDSNYKCHTFANAVLILIYIQLSLNLNNFGEILIVKTAPTKTISTNYVELNEAGSADQFAYKLIEDNSSNMAQKMIYIPACVSFCMPLINLGINSIFSSIQQIAATKRRGVAGPSEPDQVSGG